MKTGWAAALLIALGAAFSLLAGGVIFLVSRQPRGQPIRLVPPPTAAPLVVQVGGGVLHPGVYQLPPGSRIVDAIQAAGDLLPEANIQGVNQAAPVQDGELIWVPITSPASPAPSASTPGALSQPSTRSSNLPEPQFPININTAASHELEALPHIGPALAQRIVDYRSANGPFLSPQDIQAVVGIGPGIYEDIQDLITVEEVTP